MRKFDTERILCHICDRWLHVPSTNHAEALRQWTSHRTACQNLLAIPSPPQRDQLPAQCANSQIVFTPPCSNFFFFSPPRTVLPRSEQKLALTARATPSVPGPSLSTVRPTNDTPQNASSSSFKKDLNLNNFPASQETRRQSAEQRAVALRSDPLLQQVEHNRVFCKLCQKWVQLRQDSSYCAYPWLQHRSKCLIRK